MLKSKVYDCVFNSTAGTVGRKVILMRIKIISSDYSQNGKPKSLIEARLDRQTLFLAILWNRLGRQRLNHQQNWRTLHTICNYSSQNLLFHQHSKLKYAIFSIFQYLPCQLSLPLRSVRKSSTSRVFVFLRQFADLLLCRFLASQRTAKISSASGRLMQSVVLVHFQSVLEDFPALKYKLLT